MHGTSCTASRQSTTHENGINQITVERIELSMKHFQQKEMNTNRIASPNYNNLMSLRCLPSHRHRNKAMLSAKACRLTSNTQFWALNFVYDLRLLLTEKGYLTRLRFCAKMMTKSQLSTSIPSSRTEVATRSLHRPDLTSVAK